MVQLRHHEYRIVSALAGCVTRKPEYAAYGEYGTLYLEQERVEQLHTLIATLLLLAAWVGIAIGLAVSTVLTLNVVIPWLILGLLCAWDLPQLVYNIIILKAYLREHQALQRQQAAAAASPAPSNTDESSHAF